MKWVKILKYSFIIIYKKLQKLRYIENYKISHKNKFVITYAILNISIQQLIIE